MLGKKLSFCRPREACRGFPSFCNQATAFARLRISKSFRFLESQYRICNNKHSNALY